MHRNVTAVYRTHAVADLVRRDLEKLGISQGYIHVVPDTNDAAYANGQRDDSRLMDDLHDLNLPEEDVRTYQHSVRKGDYVVSANVDDDKLERVQQIMRRPETEAHNVDARSDEFRNEPVYAHSDTTRTASDPRLVGQRDLDQRDPYLRSYRREAPAPERTVL